MAVTGNEYSKMADQASPPSHKALNTLKAFFDRRADLRDRPGAQQPLFNGASQ